MPAKTVEIEEIGTVSLYKHRSSRSIRLGFDRKGQIRVSLPYYVSYQAALNFVVGRLDWITAHRPAEKLQFQDGDKIGKAHRLQFIYKAGVASPRVRLLNTSVIVTSAVQPGNPAAQAAAERGAHRALRDEAETLLPQRLKQLAKQHGFSYRGVTIKKLTSKWGSCSQHHDITLNYYLLQLPWQLIDYVLVHELVHTEHLNHSSEFWRRFEGVLPGAKKIRKELKGYQTSIVPEVRKYSSRPV